MKTIVTHITPDIDAITSVWLIKRFLPNWEGAVVAFVTAGNTLHDNDPDGDDDILHVDTGLGMLDHHQTTEFTCASRRTFEYLQEQKVQFKHQEITIEMLDRMLAIVTEIDHFRDVHYPQADADLYLFFITGIVDGWKRIHFGDDQKIIEWGMILLDGVFKAFGDRVWAEHEIEEKGIPFTSPWGKALGIESTNDEVLRLGMRRGYQLIVRKDPNKKYVRIKGMPESPVDLTAAYDVLREKDREATWFLHVSKRMLLNGTTHNPDMKPTKLTLDEIVEVLKKVKS